MTLRTGSLARDRRATRMTLLALGATIALAVGAFAFAVAGGRDVDTGSPQDTVRDFLITAAVDHDGVDGCGYLTPRAMSALESVEPRDTTCHEALTDAGLTLGGQPVVSEAEVKALGYRVTGQGRRLRVTVSAHGAATTFVLVRANGTELAESGAPPTPWRIDSGVDRLARP